VAGRRLCSYRRDGLDGNLLRCWGNPNANSDCYSNAYSDADGESQRNAYSDADGNTYCNCHSNTNPDTDGDT